MIYTFSLSMVAVVVGIALIAAHVFALAAPKPVQGWLEAFPRSKPVGTVLLVLAAVWAFWLGSTMDLGEFARLRTPILVAIPIGAVLTWMFVDEFLAVRMLGVLALLAAEPLLSAAFLQESGLRIFVVLLAYVWILLGLFWVGMPYVLRDQISWVTRNATRWKLAAGAGLGYGLLLCLLGLVFF